MMEGRQLWKKVGESNEMIQERGRTIEQIT
jgi:hypothetical protein